MSKSGEIVFIEVNDNRKDVIWKVKEGRTKTAESAQLITYAQSRYNMIDHILILTVVWRSPDACIRSCIRAVT